MHILEVYFLQNETKPQTIHLTEAIAILKEAHMSEKNLDSLFKSYRHISTDKRKQCKQTSLKDYFSKK